MAAVVFNGIKFLLFGTQVCEVVLWNIGRLCWVFVLACVCVIVADVCLPADDWRRGDSKLCRQMLRQ